MIRRTGAPAALLAALLLAGCAGPAVPSASGPSSLPPPPPSGPPASVPPSSALPGSSMPLDPMGPPSTRPGTATGTQTLTGVVVAGVEPNCLILRHSSGDYLLLMSGGAPAARVGAKVTATGRADKGIVTTCQQGTPFVVAEIRAA